MAERSHFRTNVLIVTLVFIILGSGLNFLTYLYWQTKILPRLEREAISQAILLSQSQSVRINHALDVEDEEQREQALEQAAGQILLTADPDTETPFFSGLSTELDYDMIWADPGSLDKVWGDMQDVNAFNTEVAIFSAATDELFGIAHFKVSNRFFERLTKDMKHTLFTRSVIGTIMMFAAWFVFVLMMVWTNRLQRRLEENNRLLQQEIRERENSENALRESEKRLRLREEDLKKARDAADAANRAKSIFLANMSHELRTPLNAIIGFTQLMGQDNALSEKDRETLAIISRSGEYLLTLINDVLEMSRVEAGQSKLNQDSFDLLQTIDYLEKMMFIRAEKKGLALQFTIDEDVPRYITTDEHKLQQVLINLTGNAVKFTDSGRVALRVSSPSRLAGLEEETGDQKVRIDFTIEDTGPGIPGEAMDSLFEAFTRSHNDTKEGSGLGLAISKQFVAMMGGEIQVQSTVGKGSLFQFSISATLASSMVDRTSQWNSDVIGIKPNPLNEKGEPYRVLIVEDNLHNRLLIERILEKVGLNLRFAANGLEAVEMEKSWKPHLVYMDLRMPLLDGYEATRRIRQRHGKNGTEQPKIVALTASAFIEERDKALSHGCDEFVRKPYRDLDIFNTLHNLLGLPFLYADEARQKKGKTESQTADKPDIRGSLATLSADLKNSLQAALEMSDLEEIDAVMPGVVNHDAALAEWLKKQVNNFAFETILELLERNSESI